MLALFRSYYAYNHILLLVYTLAVRHVFLMKSIAVHTESDSWIWSSMLQMVPSITIQNLLATVLLWIHSILINNMANEHKLGRENSLFPGLFYILLMTLLPEGLSLHALLLANTFLIPGFTNIIDSTKHVDIRHFLFNSGFFLTIAAFIYQPYLLLLVIGFISYYNMKSLKPMGNIQYITGILTASILYFGVQYVITGNFGYQINFQFISRNIFSIPTSVNLVIFGVMNLSFVGFVLSQYNLISIKKNIQTRKKIELGYVLMFSMLIMTLLFFHQKPVEMLTLAFPLGTLMGLRLAEFKSVVWAELTHLSLLIGLLFIHYHQSI